MPRKARIDAPGALHHVICRGIERTKIFRDDLDRVFFVRRLGGLVGETRTKCLAWALIPNHFHLLLKTGDVPIATFMRRLLTGYAVSHNRRHCRSGYLFQNRYKSILCQEDAYFKELVRYIHLNPLRAGLATDMMALDRFRFAGHSYIIGKNRNDWQSVADVLALFGDKKGISRQRYRQFVRTGIELGRQPELMGGGLVRSAGGWSAVRSLRQTGIFQKSDERILGDGDFVQTAIAEAQETVDRRYRLSVAGVGFEEVLTEVSNLLSIHPQKLTGPSKERSIVKGRALICYWTVRELGMSMTDVAYRLKIAVPTVSVAVKKGEKIAAEAGYNLSEMINIKI